MKAFRRNWVRNEFEAQQEAASARIGRLAEIWGVDARLVRYPNRGQTRMVRLVRQLVMWELREIQGWPFEKIAWLFNFDHSTVHKGISKGRDAIVAVLEREAAKPTPSEKRARYNRERRARIARAKAEETARTCPAAPDPVRTAPEGEAFKRDPEDDSGGEGPRVDILSRLPPNDPRSRIARELLMYYA